MADRLHLAWLACGADEVKVQARYSVLSALAWRDDAPVDLHVYTDRGAAFAGLEEVEVVEVAPGTARAWRGAEDLVFRMKPCIALDLARRFPSHAVGLVDADTFFVRPAAALASRVAPGRAVMHVREYHVATADTPQMRKFRKNVGRLSFRGAPVELDAFMWNSGVLAVDPAEFPHLETWLEFVDAIYPRYRKAFVEQYAISLALQRSAEIVAADDLVFHYWFQKDDYVARIREHLAALARLPPAMQAEFLRARRIVLPPPAQRRHRRRGLLARLLGR